jgi:hypothetical protein
MKSEPSNAMLNGLTSQLMPTVTAMPRHCSATLCNAPKSTLSSIGTIISQISTAIGILTSATVIRPSAWNGAGKSRPSTIPAMMQSATHTVK